MGWSTGSDLLVYFNSNRFLSSILVEAATLEHVSACVRTAHSATAAPTMNRRTLCIMVTFLTKDVVQADA